MTATGAPTGTPLEVRDPSACFRLRELLVWLPLGALLWFPAAGLLLGWHRLAMREDGLVLAAAWFYLTVLAWMLATLRRERLSLLDLLGPLPRGPQWLDVVVLPLLHLGFSGALMLCFVSMLARWRPSQLAHWMRGNGGLDLGHTGVVGSLLVIAVLAPLVEELVFRGILLHRAARRFGVVRGLLATALLFGVLHINPVGLFAFGLLLGATALQTRSLWLTTFAHMVNNAVPLLMILSSRGAPHGPEVFPTEGFAQALPATAALALAMAVSIGLTLRLRWPSATGISSITLAPTDTT